METELTKSKTLVQFCVNLNWMSDTGTQFEVFFFCALFKCNSDGKLNFDEIYFSFNTNEEKVDKT